MVIAVLTANLSSAIQLLPGSLPAGTAKLKFQRTSEVFGLAGVTNRSVRVCNECIDICLEIPKDDLYAPTVGAPPPPSEPVVSREISEPFDFEETVLAHNVGLPRTEAELEALMERVREILDQSERDRPRTAVGEQKFISNRQTSFHHNGQCL